MNPQTIEQRMRDNTLSPHEMAEARTILSGEMSFLTGKLMGVLSEKPFYFIKHRQSYSSDTACERAWEATEQGLEELRLKMTIKSYERMMSALKTSLEIHSMEARSML